MKTTKLISLFALLFMAFSNMYYNTYAGDFATDTVWLRKGIEYYGGELYNNDDNLVTYPTKTTHFYNTLKGEKIYELPNANKLLFGYNDEEFYQISNDRKYFVRYNTRDFTILDSIRHDIETFNTNYIFSKSQLYLYEISKEKVKIWDLNKKSMINELYFEKEIDENLYLHEINAAVDCDNENIIVKHAKQFRPSNYPGSWYDKRYITFYNSKTLEKIKTIKIEGGGFTLSPNCNYFALVGGYIDLYNYKTLEYLFRVENEKPGAMIGYCFSPDERYLFITNINRYIIQIWDLKTKKMIKSYDDTLPGIVFAISKDNQFAYCRVGRDFYKLRLNLEPNSIEEDITGDTKPYPNPTNGSLEIKYSVQHPNVFQYEVTNLSGQILIRNNLGFKNIGENIETIELSNLPLGQYNLKLYSLTEQFNFKFIKGE